MKMGPAVRRAIERRFAGNFAALSLDEWMQVSSRGLEAAARAGRIAAELAELDQLIRRSGVGTRWRDCRRSEPSATAR